MAHLVPSKAGSLSAFSYAAASRSVEPPSALPVAIVEVRRTGILSKEVQANCGILYITFARRVPRMYLGFDSGSVLQSAFFICGETGEAIFCCPGRAFWPSKIAIVAGLEWFVSAGRTGQEYCMPALALSVVLEILVGSWVLFTL